MNRQDKNNNGDTAESIVHVLFNRLNLTCRIRKLGEKWPITDMYVEFEHRNLAPFLFLQVKSTFSGYTGNGKLKINVSKNQLNKLAKFKAPTYLVGIDFKDKSIIPKAFIVTVRGDYKKGIGTIPASTSYEVSKANLLKLKDEVIQFWQYSKTTKPSYKTNFK